MDKREHTFTLPLRLIYTLYRNVYAAFLSVWAELGGVNRFIK